MSKDTSKYVTKGLISQSDFEFLKELDPSRTQKYLPFIIKSYLADGDLDDIRNRVTEYDALLERNQVDRRDINAFKTFQQFDEYVQAYNNIKSTKELKREAKKQAEIILDNDALFIVCPQSHEASCLYGAGTKWCITAQNDVHFERYFYAHLITIYFIQVRSEAIKNNLSQDSWKVAVVVYPDNRIIAYNAIDKIIGKDDEDTVKALNLYNLFETLGVESSLFIPRGIDERMVDFLDYSLKRNLTELDLSRKNISIIPDAIGEMEKLEKLDLSENKIRSLPETIGLLSNLKSLYLFHNELTALPQSLRELKQLQWLGLTGNMLSNKTIRELKRELPNTRIYMEKDKAEPVPTLL